MVQANDVGAAAEPIPSHPAERGAPTTVLPVTSARSFPGIVGASAALTKALRRLEAAIDVELPVLVVGETGVGKELFARALHDHGARAERAFVAINCAAIPDALFEAELFGHARGAFTGADRPRSGLLARAEGGTLLLDEIGELPLLRQAALLRVLESRRYRSVGSDEERSFDVRIIAATNRDLESAVLEGSFRRDLLYRLNAVEIRVPPLRERRGDVLLLLESFLARSATRAVLTAAAKTALEGYGWPGNVRELEHVAQRLAASKLARIDVVHLPRPIRSNKASRQEPEDERPASTGDPRDEVRSALERAGGNISRAAATLGLTRHGLKKRMVRLGLRAPRAVSEDDRET
jgi:two-component system response regulator HydG